MILTLVGIAQAAVLAFASWPFGVIDRDSSFFGYDSHAYWAASVDDLYGYGHAPARDAFLYSPAIGQLADVFGAFDWPTFREAWRASQVSVLGVLTGPFAGPLLLTPPLRDELLVGNVSLLIALAVVVGFRWPAAWAFVLLTKVTPGVGLLWFVARKEWRSLGIALVATAVIAGVSLVAVPQLWGQWIELLRTTPPTVERLPAVPPLPLRLAAAAVLVWWGGRNGYRWTVPLAAALGHGHLWTSAATVAVAALALIEVPPGRLHLVRRISVVALIVAPSYLLLTVAQT